MPSEKHYAVLDGGGSTVLSVLVGDDGFITANYPGAIRIDQMSPEPGVGWTLAAGVFTSPPAPAIPPAFGTQLTRIAFRLLFTNAEMTAIDNFATAAGLSNAQKAAINTGLINFAQADRIDLSAAYVITAVTFLGTVGLITPTRAAAILATRV